MSHLPGDVNNQHDELNKSERKNNMMWHEALFKSYFVQNRMKNTTTILLCQTEFHEREK